MSENLPGNEPNATPVPPAAPSAPPVPPTYSAQGAPGVPAYAGAPVQPKGLALSSMIVGIVSLVLSWPLSVIGIIGGIVALVLGIVARKKGQAKGLSLTGIITGSVAIVLGILVLIIVAVTFAAVVNDPNFQQQLQEQLDQQ